MIIFSAAPALGAFPMTLPATAPALGAGLMTPPAARPEVSWDRTGPRLPGSPDQPIRVAILGFLLNWPTTGGGNHHTAELPKFLALAGYEVKHFFARYQGWGIARVTDELISPSEAIPFDKSSWNVPDIPARFRQAVDSFAPDFVMITGAWNMKPLLAEAVRGYPDFLLYQAQENLEPAPAGD